MEIEQMLANAFRDLSIQYTYLKPLRIPDISFDQKDKLLFLKGVSFPEFNDAKTTNDMSVYVAAFKQALQNNQVKIKSVADGKQYREDGTGTGSMLPMVDFEIALNPITHE